MAEQEPQSAPAAAMTMRQLVALVVLTLVALVFALSFGLPSDALSGGVSPVVRVHGKSIYRDDWMHQKAAVERFVYPLPEDERYAELVGIKETLLEYIVERGVLEDLAYDLSLAADVHDAEQLIEPGFLVVLGDPFLWRNPNDPFDYQTFTKGLLPTLATSEPVFLETQRQEIAAMMVRDLLMATVVVPEPVVREAYETDANRIDLEYVRFSATSFADLVDLSQAEIDAYAQLHREALLERLEGQRLRFAKLPPQAHVRAIRLTLPVAPEDGATADVVAAHAAAVARVEDRARSLLAALEGGADMRALAREWSDDGATGHSGGDFGWLPTAPGASGLDREVEEVIAAMDAGGAVALARSSTAAWLVRVEGRREGDVSDDDALHELAEEGARRERGHALAKQAAAEAILATQGGKTLTEQFTTLGADLAQSFDPNAPNFVRDANHTPQLRRTGPFVKGRPIPGLGVVPSLAQTIWSPEHATELVEQPVELEDGWAVARVASRTITSDDDFQQRRQDLWDDARVSQARRVTSTMAQRRCLDAKGRAEIAPYQDKIDQLIQYSTGLAVDEDGNRALRPYSVCDRVGSKGKMLMAPGLMGGRLGGGDR